MESIHALIIEDNPGDALLLQENLKEIEHAEFKLQVVGTLAAAQNLFRHECFDVIFLDLNLPDGQGITLISQVQGLAPGVPIIVQTGMDDDEMASEALRTGVQDYLIKGYHEPDVLWRSLRYARERKGFEEKIKRAQEEAEEAARMRAEFLAHMSHEIRNPLNALLGATDLLGNQFSSPEQQQLLQVIRNTGSGILYILDNILHLAKLEAGKMQVEVMEFNLMEQLKEIENSFNVQAKKKELRFSLVVYPDTPMYLWGDSHKIKQVLYNLVGNAYKFTQKGQVNLSVKATDIKLGEVTLQFSVTDTGPGVPPDKQREIFEAFSQADVSITRQFGGTGLGLTLCKQFVKLMGGHLWLESDGRTGSTFSFTVKLKLAEQLNPAENTATLSFVPQDVQSLDVLMIDDSQDNQAILELVLKGKVNHFAKVYRGEDGFSLLKEKNFDCIFVDYEMPGGWNGLDTIKKIRELEKQLKRKPTCLILLTAHSDEKLMQKAREAGADTYLSKPIHLQTILETLQKVSLHIHKPKVENIRSEDSDLDTLIPEYLNRKHQDIHLLQEYISTQNFEGIRIIGHNLKGTGLVYGFPEITRMGKEIELNAKESNHEALKLGIEKFKHYIDSLPIPQRSLK